MKQNINVKDQVPLENKTKCKHLKFLFNPLLVLKLNPKYYYTINMIG